MRFSLIKLIFFAYFLLYKQGIFCHFTVFYHKVLKFSTCFFTFFKNKWPFFLIYVQGGFMKQTIIIFFQFLICILVICSCICINAMKQKQSVSVGAFANSNSNSNHSFSDLAQTLQDKLQNNKESYAN